MQFEWDPGKAASNLVKHGIEFSEASKVFGDLLSRTIADPDTFAGEQRFITIGRLESGSVLVVVHVDRSDVVRIVSARRASRKEQKRYEQES